MKNILHIIDSLGRGGAETLLLNTINDLPQYKHFLCYLGGAEDFLGDASKYVEVIKLNYNNKQDLPRSIFKLKRILKEHSIHIVHSHLMTSTHISRLAHGKIPLISTVHNILSEDSFKANKLALPLERALYNRNDVTVFVSQCAKDDYKKYIPKLNDNKSFVFHNYVHNSFINQKHSKIRNADEQLRIVAVGNLRHQKNYFNILKAFTFIKDKNIVLDVYGDGPLKSELQKFIDTENIKVILKGRHNNIISVLDNYDIYLMGSLYEGCPIAPMEALCYGMPLLVSDIPPLREIVGENGQYFNPEDSKDLSEKLLDINNNWGSFKQQSVNNKSWASKLYSKENYLNKLTGLYNNILQD